MSGLKETMQDYAALAEAWMDREYAVPDLPERRLFEAMRYSAAGGGKRLRPVLSLAVCDLLGGDREETLAFACALESIHTYSLIHDDLPAMDDDDLRRGRPTNHKVFGEAAAILAGDALLNRAFEILFAAIRRGGCAPRLVEAAAMVADASGANGMIAGQTLDMEGEGRQIPLEELRRMHRLKTGAIIRAAAGLSAILCGADEKVRSAIDRYASAIGVAFQIKDDLLDVQSTTEVLGKPVGSDERNVKSTYVGLLGIEGAQTELNRAVSDACGALENFGEGAAFLKELAEWIASRSH